MNSNALAPIVPPGSSIGILGGGQLGRMSALAAAELGYKVHIFAPDIDAPASRVAHRTTLAPYDDRNALEAFARAVDAATIEFENVPTESVAFLERLVPVFPGSNALAVCQDRVAEKTFARRLGIPTAPFAVIDSDADFPKVQEIAMPAILKTRREGYDGKGQIRLTTAEEIAPAFESINRRPAILEAMVDFRREVSVIAARNTAGQTAVFPLAENHHRDGILARSIAPAPDTAHIADRALEIGRMLVEGLDIVGLLAVELFESPDGQLLVNEMAPRPHNSGHWTQDACRTSQFEQHIRAICGLPLGATTATATAVMDNLIGDRVDDWQTILSDPEARLHLYDKGQARPGRKMGHVTRISRS